MRRVNNYKIQKESYDDMYDARRYNPSLEIVFTDKTGTHTHKIGAGLDDDLDVYREGPETYVLSRNFGLEYVGLEIFNGCSSKKITT